MRSRMEIKISGYRAAYYLGKRTFVERYPDVENLTIRSYPENYCLAERTLDEDGNYRWTYFADGATRKYWQKIQDVLDKYGDGSTADALAEAIGMVIPKDDKGWWS